MLRLLSLFILLMPVLLFPESKKVKAFDIDQVLNQVKVKAPASLNKPVAVIANDTIFEYDVFGFPNQFNVPKLIPLEEKESIIKNYVLRKIYAIEGRKTDFLNSDKYKSARLVIQKDIAVDFLFNKKIIDNVFPEDSVRFFYNENRSRFNGSFEEEKQEVYKFIKSKRFGKLKKLVTDQLDAIKKKYEVHYNHDLYDKISKLVTRSKNETRENLKKFANNSTEYILMHDNQKNIVTIADVQQLVENVMEYKLLNYSDKEILIQSTEGKILNNLLKVEAEIEGLVDNDEVIKIADSKMDGFIGTNFIDYEFPFEKYYVSGGEAYEYYKNNPDDSRLISPRKARVFEVIVPYDDLDSDPDNDKIKVAIKVENMRQKVLSGEATIESYMRFYNRPMSKKGDLSYISEDEFGKTGEVSAKLKEGEISDLIEHPKAFGFIMNKNVVEPRLYDYEALDDRLRYWLTYDKIEEEKNKFNEKLLKQFKVVFFSVEEN
ncbi:MAG: hypothetical protein JXR48_09515 [Candidatus Delongbacteria bacterium]|nr:hypothetical protein [Candidatus Delongbacteria bacterium]MBN2835190.1 hypothetical protein [Candidatus Delongbacteria bacterium]